MDNLIEVKGVLDQSQKHLFRRGNVVATGVGYKVTGGEKTPKLSIVCSVTEKLPLSQLSAGDRVPEVIDGIPTDVLATGVIRAFSVNTGRYRPAPGGVSIGHIDITAGTLGCLVKKDGQIFILSNNHVLANSNDANIGDPILQPGPYDGGTFPADHIANLSEFVAITFLLSPSGCPIGNGLASTLNGIARVLGSKTRMQAISTQVADNLVDAAIARPLNDNDVSDEILEIGSITGLGVAELDMNVKKSGRTTGFTTGIIKQVSVTSNVNYGAGRIARFTDQLMTGPMSQGGDSGSAVLDDENRLVGLLFAGSDNSTIINRIENVFSALGLSL